MNRIAPICTLAFAATLAACAHDPGGASNSNDTYTYVSTPHLPQTVTLIDTRSMEELLRVEVPVGQQLVLSFYGSNDESEGKGSLRWGVMSAGRWYGGLTNTMDVPPASSRRVDTSLRRSPEYTRPLVQTRPGEVPTGVTIAGAPGTPPRPPVAPGAKPVEVEVTSPRAPKVDIPE